MQQGAVANWGELAAKHPEDVVSALPPPAFYDTHAGVHRLTEAGVEESHAEAIVGEQLHFFGENVASKADIMLLRRDLTTEIAAVRHETEQVRQDLKGEIEAVRRDLKGEIEAVRRDLKAEIVAVRHETEQVRQDLKGEIEVRIKETQNWFLRWGMAQTMVIIMFVVGLVKLL